MANGRKTGGRKKGIPNKLTQDIKGAIEIAFHKLGGSEWLFMVGQERPEVLAGLIGRILPKQIEQSGPGGGPQIIRIKSNARD